MTYNPADALTAAKACLLAYDAPNVWGGRGQAHVSADASGRIVVALAGTNGPGDVLDDSRIVRREVGVGLMVHAGFDRHAMDLAAPVMAAIRALPPGPLLLAGHSLGAAALCLILYRHARALPGPAYLFGCPRVGNEAFAQSLDTAAGPRLFRVVNRGDPVCGLPPPLLGRWSHAGQEIMVGRGYDWRPDHGIRHYIVALS